MDPTYFRAHEVLKILIDLFVRLHSLLSVGHICIMDICGNEIVPRCISQPSHRITKLVAIMPLMRPFLYILALRLLDVVSVFSLLLPEQDIMPFH